MIDILFVVLSTFSGMVVLPLPCECSLQVVGLVQLRVCCVVHLIILYVWLGKTVHVWCHLYLLLIFSMACFSPCWKSFGFSTVVVSLLYVGHGLVIPSYHLLPLGHSMTFSFSTLFVVFWVFGLFCTPAALRCFLPCVLGIPFWWAVCYHLTAFLLAQCQYNVTDMIAL